MTIANFNVNTDLLNWVVVESSLDESERLYPKYRVLYTGDFEDMTSFKMSRGLSVGKPTAKVEGVEINDINELTTMHHTDKIVCKTSTRINANSWVERFEKEASA